MNQEIIRRAKRFQKKEVEKNFIKKEQKYFLLNRLQKEPEIIELDKPIFAGYKRFFVMTERSEGSKFADSYRKLLEINRGIQFSATKEFKEKVGKKKVDKEMNIILDEIEFKKIPNEIRHLFIKRQNSKYKSFRIPEYLFTRKEIFKVEIKRHYLTHKILPNGKIESELAKLKQELYENRSNYAILAKARSRYVHYKGWRDLPTKYKLDLENIKEFYQTILEVNNFPY